MKVAWVKTEDIMKGLEGKASSGEVDGFCTGDEIFAPYKNEEHPIKVQKEEIFREALESYESDK